jgi:hypothetical protein
VLWLHDCVSQLCKYVVVSCLAVSHYMFLQISILPTLGCIVKCFCKRANSTHSYISVTQLECFIVLGMCRIIIIIISYILTWHIVIKNLLLWTNHFTVLFLDDWLLSKVYFCVHHYSNHANSICAYVFRFYNCIFVLGEQS